jgi:tetratricopeptide (TPR) repeat protein
MFWEKRQNQGASGRVYPYPVTEGISSHREDRPYRAVYLENEYIRLALLPELGGRIFEGFDKTNSYHFFYRQHVIKPALIGLLGPWISGGVEFNWPLHHRPSTFMPVDHIIECHPDGSVTVWMGEHEALDHTQGMVGICLHPGKAYLEAKVRLYNRTPFSQTFLWWANVAVHVNDQYQVVFPPDAGVVNDHGKRFMQTFPIARGPYGVYHSYDYGAGTDISWVKNFPPPGSCFVNRSSFDFFAGYDHSAQGGMVYIGNHHISPGKKFFTWGTTGFAHAWERNLTDSDGPYIELMAGVFTDNQPDFSWIRPYETRTFSQYWYPIQQIGAVKNANLLAALNLEVHDQAARVGVCATQAIPAADIVLLLDGQPFARRQADLAPGRPFTGQFDLPAGVQPARLTLSVQAGGSEIIRYSPTAPATGPLPEVMTEPPMPAETTTLEELYLTGLHLQQYRHATRPPEDYWRAALNRDPGDVHSNNALGLLCLRRGEFAAAEIHFRTAIQRLTRWNPNPLDCEAYYNLGLTLAYQGHFDEAYTAFYKATWDAAWQAAAYYALAEIDCRWAEFVAALDHLDRALSSSADHLKARNLKAAVMRRLGRLDEARSLSSATLVLCPLDLAARFEQLFAAQAAGSLPHAQAALQELRPHLLSPSQKGLGEVGDNLPPHAALDTACDYAAAGLWDEASAVLRCLLDPNDPGLAATPSLPASLAQAAAYPLVLYALGSFALRSCQPELALAYFKSAARQSPDYIFPSRLEELLILQDALSASPDDPHAHLFLGCLLYDKGQAAGAIQHWQAAVRLNPAGWLSWRCLGLAAFNNGQDPRLAQEHYLTALQTNPDEPRLLLEYNQLMKRLNFTPDQRRDVFSTHLPLVLRRDDLYLEWIALHNLLGQPEKAIALLHQRTFHPWEGGEGAVTAQFVTANLLTGRKRLAAGRPSEALASFKGALDIPTNLGEGQHQPVHDASIHYHAGLAGEALGDLAGAQASYRRAASSDGGFALSTYYRALALRKLGETARANESLEALLERAQAQRTAEARTTFASSISSVFYWEGDFERLHHAEGAYQAGLAQLGLGHPTDARQAFTAALDLDAGHFFARLMSMTME